jgi:hypothetical protein
MGFGVTIWTPPGGSLGSIAVVFVLLFLVDEERDELDPLALPPVVAAALPPLVAAAEFEFEAEAEFPELCAALLEFEAEFEALFDAEEVPVVAAVAKVNESPFHCVECTYLEEPAVSISRHLYSPATGAMAMLLIMLKERGRAQRL